MTCSHTMKLRLAQFLTWLTGFMMTCTAANYLCFTIYQNALRVQFDMRQEEVSLAISFTQLGIVTAIPSSYLTYHYGERLTTALALVVGAGSYVLVWMATYHKDFHKENPWLLWLYFFMAGVGAGLSYIPALSAPMRRFHEKHAASIAGTITTAEAVGPLIYTFIYDTYFSGDGSFLGQDLRGYMLFLPASILVTHLIGLVIFGWYQYDNVEPEMIPIIVKDKHKIRQSIPMDDIHNLQSIDSAVASCSSTVQDPVNDTIERSINESNLECTPIQMIKTPTFQIMIWSTVLVHNMKLFCIYNVNVFLVSLKMQKYATVLPFLSPASSAVSKTAFGWLIEKLRGRFSLAWYMVIACVINIIFFVLGLIYLSNIYVLAFGIVFWTFASDVALVIEPVMNLEYFGKAMISINYGFFMGLWSAVTFLNQLWFGKAYEFYADPASGMCYGDHCFRLQQITNLVISLICFGLSIAFYAIDLKQKVKILITGSNVMLQSEQ